MSENQEHAGAHPSLEAYENVRIWSRCTFLSLVLAYGLTYFSGWAGAFALPLFALTIGLAVTTLVKMIKLRFPFFSILLMIMIIMWSVFLSFSTGVQLLFADTAGAYANCIQQALTISRAEQCAAEMSDGIFNQLLGN